MIPEETQEELMKRNMHRMGKRKSLFRESMFKEGYKLGALGLTFEEIARFWNITTMSLQRWMRKNSDFANEVNRGRDDADMSVIQVVMQQARGINEKGERIDPNITAAIFWLKNRRKEWRKENTPPPPPSNGGALSDLPTEQLIAILQKSGVTIEKTQERILSPHGGNGNGKSIHN